MRQVALALLALLALAACSRAPAPPAAASWPEVELAPEPNPLPADDPRAAPLPLRTRPRALAVTADGAKAYVALSGRVDAPGTDVAVIDLAAGRELGRIPVGRSPWALALHPGGRFLVALVRYASFAAVIDVTTDRVVARVPVPFYTEGIVFSADGRTAWLASRWKDSVLRWDVDASASFRVVATSYDGKDLRDPMGVPVGTNPRALALSPDGTRLFAGAVAGLSVSVIDTARGVELARLPLNAPALDLAIVGDLLAVAHTGRGTGHPPDRGFDGDRDGAPGDGTANVMFQDLQNELSLFDVSTLEEVARFTSDTICCKDFREVDPDHPERGAALPRPDPWGPERIAHLPPKETWLLAGALPEALAVLPGLELYVAFSGSNEVQGFAVDGPRLAPLQVAGGLYRTGFQPMALAPVPGTRKLLVAEQLSDAVSILDLDAGPAAAAVRVELPAGPSSPPFPATDAELGEAINFVTSPFTVDGDQTCAHCHRDGGNLEKSVAMPLQVLPEWGTRQVMAYRGAFDTRPWFFETAMTDDNFFPVLNEFARKENFCCETLDPLVFSRYPTPSACTAAPDTPGCEHVLRCRETPPPECATRGYGSPFPTRSELYVAASRTLFGRDHAFGDVLDDGGGNGVLLDFDGITRAVGLFLLREPRLLPNPNAFLAGAAEARGGALYQSPDVGCAGCHPLPETTTATGTVEPGAPLRFPPVLTPLRSPEGRDADVITGGFVATFPLATQSEAGLHVGSTQLRGLWDRGDAFFHDGRARSLTEALATPGHPALAPGAVGHNARDGQVDTHGGTSQLSPTELADLEAFLRSL